MPTYKQSVNATDEWLVYARRHLASTSSLSNASIGDEFNSECENSAYSILSIDVKSVFYVFYSGHVFYVFNVFLFFSTFFIFK